MTAEVTTEAREVEPPRPRRRFNGLFPDSLLHHRQPKWWQEIAIIGFCYWIYSQVRNLVPEQASIADRHGRGVQHLQDALHLNFELSLNRFVAEHEPLAQVMNYYYATLHFVVTIGCLVWLYRAHPRIYRGARTVLFATSLIALAGFYLYPLTPPRLLPQYGYVDTLITLPHLGLAGRPQHRRALQPVRRDAEPAHGLGAVVRRRDLLLRPPVVGARARRWPIRCARCWSSSAPPTTSSSTPSPGWWSS